jgi:hypothetical protein
MDKMLPNDNEQNPSKFNLTKWFSPNNAETIFGCNENAVQDTKVKFLSSIPIL